LRRFKRKAAGERNSGDTLLNCNDIDAGRENRIKYTVPRITGLNMAGNNMGLPYFKGNSWSDLTREERFYCFCLYQRAKENPRKFAEFIKEEAKLEELKIDQNDDWDVGVEVCFYRDYLWHQNKSVKTSELSQKRTFDLCLFGPNAMIIIEAKVDQRFDSAQNAIFEEEKTKIPKLIENDQIKIYLVALASQKYYDAAEKYGNGKALNPFDGCISWADVHQKYNDAIFQQADELYGSKKRKLVD
jgi:hypothetical protein